MWICAVTEQREPTGLAGQASPTTRDSRPTYSAAGYSTGDIARGKREAVWFRLDGSTGSQIPQVLVAAPDASTKEQRSAVTSGFPGKPSSHLVQAKPAIKDG